MTVNRRPAEGSFTATHSNGRWSGAELSVSEVDDTVNHIVLGVVQPTNGT